MASGFKPSPNVTVGNTYASGSSHEFTGSVNITGSLTLNGDAITGGGGSPLTVKEVGGVPNVPNVTTINVSNGTLTDNTGGEVTITTGGGGGTGDVTGPALSTDNAIARYDLATGKIIQNSGVTIDDSNNIDGAITITTIDVSASSNISASSFYGSADNLSASSTAHDSRNPILSKLDATGKINAEQYLSFENLSGHSYLYLGSSGPSRRPHLIFEHGLPGTAGNNRTELWSNAADVNDPFYLSRRSTSTYYPLTIWQNILDQADDKVGINIPYGEEAAYRFDVSGSSRFQEDVTVTGTLSVSGNLDVCYGTASFHHVSGCSPTIDMFSALSSSQAIYAKEFWGDGEKITNLTLPSGTVNRTDNTGFVTYYDTVSGAVAAATTGDFVRVGPGTYIEDTPIIIPSGISVIGEAGWQVTDVSSSTGTGDVFVLSDASLLRDFKIAVPSDTGSYAAKFSGSNGEVATINFLQFYGGTGSRGCGYGNQGEGKSLGLEIRYGSGDCDAIMQVEDGILAVEGMHVPNSAGSVDAGVRANSPSATRIGRRGRFQGVDVNMGATNVEDAIVVGSTSTVVMQGINLFNVQNSFHLTSNSASLLVTSGLSDPTVNDIKVDAALTGDSAVTRLNCFMNGAFDIPTTWIPSDHAWTFFTTADNAAGATQQLWGGDQIIGHPEYGGGFSAGEGTGYSTNNAVFTTDGTTDAPGNDGTGFVDVSVEAASKEDSTFSFQDVGAGHSILWCTKRKDSSAATLKHWGVEIDQTTAAVTGSGGFIFERQTAANTWVEIGSMAVSTDEVYRYANNVFLRANSEEKIFVGISDGDTWPETLINGVTGHWLRARIGTAITTAPVFERMRLIPSHTSTNNRGQRMATGLAMWQKTLTKFPSMGGGMLPDTTYTVGSGGNISFLIKDNVLDSAANDGSVAGTLLELPTGICTAFPLQIKLIYTFKTVSTATSFNFKHYVAQVQGNLIADPAGGAIPIVRPLDDTDVWTTNAVVTDAHSTPAGVADKILSITKTTPADLADFYAGDFIFIEVDITTMNSQISIVGLEIEGVAFYDGPPQ